MILKLPIEIVFDILSFLTFQDRLNLVKTCRNLRNVISEGHLYEELPTFKSGCKLRDALDLFRSYPTYGSQVKRLKIIIDRIDAEVLIHLPIILPNIKEFRTSDTLWNIKESEIEMLSRWKDTLEKCHVEEDRLRIAHLLKYNLFSRLSSLTIALPPTFFYKYENTRRNTTVNSEIGTKNRVQKPNTNLSALQLSRRIQANNNFAYQMMKTTQRSNMFFTDQNFHFFDCFKNTPSLKHLELFGGNLYVEYLEKLHTVCPQLTSLSLSSLNLYVGDIDTLPSLIEPVTQLLSLKLNYNSCIHNSQNGVLDYLITKYTKLNELTLLSGFYETSSFIFRGTDSVRNDLSDEWHRKKREFISSLPSTIKILKLNTGAFKDPIAALEESALDLTELAFYSLYVTGELIPASVIVHPKQLDYFKSLNSLKSLTLEWNSVMEDYNDGPILKNVSNLTVRISDEEIESDEYTLGAILLTYPSLTSLVVKKKSFLHSKRSPIATENSSHKVIYPNLRKLTLCQFTIDCKVTNFIRKSLPNLKNLELNILYPPVNTDTGALINLEGCNLDILNLTLDNVIPKGLVMILYLQVKILDELKSYKVKIVDSNKIGCIAEPEENRPTNEMIRIVCDNIKALKINGMDTKPFLNYIH